jgi:similar to stage IV sporulation protein
MFLVHLWNYIRGYVIIIVKGRSIERFINICARRQILLWDIMRRDSSSAVMKASLKGFAMMRVAARKSGCRVHITKRCGLPFFFGHFRKRKGFKAGLIIFAIMMFLLTSMIWDIEIEGCGADIAGKIEEALASGHIRKGMFKFGLNPNAIARNVLMSVDGIAWAGVQIKGVKLTVTIRPSVPRPVMRGDEACNVVAERDGIVTSIEVLAGSAKVKEGDTVRKGQVLVSGRIESKTPEFGAKDIHALGRVIARTWYDIRIPIVDEYTRRERTGKTLEKKYIRLLNWKLKLPGGRNKFEIYDTDSHDKTIAGPFNIRLPIGVTVETIYEVNETVVRLSPEEAKAMAIEKARRDLTRMLPEDCRVVDEKINLEGNDAEGMYIELIFECEEDIGGLEPIGG